MIKNDDGVIIDINNIQFNTEITFKALIPDKIDIENTNISDNKFTYEEMDIKDSSSSIKFHQYDNSILITILGPRECKYRDKTRHDSAIVEVYTKLNYEASKDKLKKINGLIQNFCESLIFLDEYPRCQINLVIHVLSYSNELLLYTSIFNGIMLALGISGIDLKTFALTTCFRENNKNIIVSLDANMFENILLIESDTPLKIDEYKGYLDRSKEQVGELYNKFKKVLIKKLS